MWYKEIMILEMPRYLKEKGKARIIVKGARFRLGSKMRRERG